MKVRVNPDRCQGHTLCWLAVPEVFQISEVDGHASAISEDVPPELEKRVADAVLSCPEQAIEVIS